MIQGGENGERHKGESKTRQVQFCYRYIVF
jgi:hypothetical protein